jgi:hypothetical protein
MKYALVAGAAALGLSACTTTGLLTPLSPSYVKSLKAACATAEQLYPTFKTLADGGLLKPSVIKNGNNVYQVAQVICSTPDDATYGDVAMVMAQAAVLAKILKDAK